MSAKTMNFKVYSTNVSKDASFLVRPVRVFYLLALLLFILIIQNSQIGFINAGVIIPVFSVLSLSFLFNSLYLLFQEKIKSSFADIALFAFDALAITALLFITKANHPVFLVLYLVNIGLCGLKHGKSGALLLAFWSSILFSTFLILGPEFEKQTLYLSMVVNNAAFFGIAAISSYLSSYILALTSEIEEKSSDIKALQELNEMIVSNVANGLISVDENWRVTNSNKSANNMFGMSELMDKSLKELFLSSFSTIKEFAGTIDDSSSHRIEMDWISHEKQKKTLEIIISKMIDSKSNFKGYVLLIQDLTQMKKLEGQLRQQEKLAAVGQLAAGIAHEVRNPLASISGSIQLLVSSPDINEDNEKLMNITLKEIDRLNVLITDFLEYVRPEEKGMDLVNINQMLMDLLSMVQLNDKLNQEVKQATELLAEKDILANKGSVKQALLNIIINAYQAMDKSEAPQLSIKTFDKEKSVVVSIKDNGEGMSEENLKRIFEPFHTTKAKGTGLGLAITHKALEGNGASIFVESDEGHGTEFIIEFIVDESPVGGEMRLKKQA